MLDTLIWALVGVQLGALLYSLFAGKNPWDVLGGVSIWGVVPVVILNILNSSLPHP